MKDTDYIRKWLKDNLSEDRYNHSVGCAECAEELAKFFNLDTKKAYLTGLVHDCAKNLDNEVLIDIVKNKIKTGYIEEELKNPKTY
ncbi:HDOD domain-containing protein, partial [bacterium]|nr:HDOD domain-containing protein [bacterium]